VVLSVGDDQVAGCAYEPEAFQAAGEIGVGVVDGDAFLDGGCDFLSVDHEAPMGSAAAAIGQETHGMMTTEILQAARLTMFLEVGR
jgi:hypothetical protein